MVLTYILCNQPTSQSQCNSLEKKCFQERIKKKKETAEISEFLSLASRGKQQQNQPSLNQRGIPKDDLNKVFFKVRYYLSKIALNQFRVVAKFILLPYSSIFFSKPNFCKWKAVSFMQCLLEILHSSTLHQLTYLKVLFQVKPILELMVCFSSSYQIQNQCGNQRGQIYPLWWELYYRSSLLYDARYFLVKVFLTKKVCFIQLIQVIL